MENRNEIVKEVTRLGKLGYFIEKFFIEAKKQGVDLDQSELLSQSFISVHEQHSSGIRVTDFKLAIEVLTADFQPSVASGFSTEQVKSVYNAEAEENVDPGLIVWLFEPRRSSRTKHWSGTNEYPPWHTSKLGSTLNAFAHYSYIFSLESMVFADLQSTVFLLPVDRPLTPAL